MRNMEPNQAADTQVDTGGFNEQSVAEDTFVRDDSDNHLFPEIQVKDISPIITDDCIGVYDADTPIWKACINMEQKFIIVKHKTEDLEVELKGVTEFKGRGKGIKKNSWLHLQNVDRELKGLDPWTEDDFEIEDGHRLIMDHDKAVEQAKIQIFLKMKQVRQQYGVPRIHLVIGEGQCFRADLDLCRPYKGNRKETLRPIILKEIRQWVLDELDSELAEPRADGQVVEADDVVEYYGWIGYVHYRKTGKFNYLVIATDKDGKNNPKLLVDPDTYVGESNPLKGKFKFPQAMLIEATDRMAGDIVAIPKGSNTDHKFYGFKGLLWQAFLSGDSADNYNCLSHLNSDLKFGDESAYKLLKPCKTAKEALQATIDKFAEILPYGVQYTNHKGDYLDVDTITYMGTYFQVAYMLRAPNDKGSFEKLCKAMGVDTKAITHNNTKTPPQRVLDASGEDVDVLAAEVAAIADGISGFSSMKKGELVELLKSIKSSLEDLAEEFEGLFSMKSLPKEDE